MKWEYQAGKNFTNEGMNVQGRDGWEAYAAVPDAERGEVLIFFKRPIPTKHGKNFEKPTVKQK